LASLAEIEIPSECTEGFLDKHFKDDVNSSLLHAVCLRGLEVKCAGDSKLANFWRGGSYQEGQNLERMGTFEFSLSLERARFFSERAGRKRPCIFRLPVDCAVRSFREKQLEFRTDTHILLDVFGYSRLVVLNGNPREIGLEAYRLEI